MNYDSYARPYQGLKVVDLSQGYAAPYCGMLLAQYGADVIKVEPLQGDWIRHLGVRNGDHTAHSLTATRGKRSLALDLKAPASKEILRRLFNDCDIVLESNRPGVARRLGIDYDSVKALNPRVLYLSVSGFGQQGPDAERPGSDTLIQAGAGIMAINRGEDAVPHKVGFIMVDAITGLYAFQAIATSLMARQQVGEGRYIDVSLTQAAAALQAAKIAEYHLEGAKPALLNAPAGSYRCQDGWIAITLVKEAHFIWLCEVLELPGLPNDERFTNFATRSKYLSELKPLLQEKLLTRTVADWSTRFRAVDVMATRINDYGDWLADEHNQAIQAVVTVDQTAVGPLPVPNIPGLPMIDSKDSAQQAPAVGEHSMAILRELGLDDASIEILVAEKTISC